MAEALSKSNLMSSCHHKYLEPRLVSDFSKNSALKLKSSDFLGKRITLHESQRFSRSQISTVKAQTGLLIRKAQKWWEKGLQQNMKEVTSAEDLVGSLLTAGDKLVVVAFFSPGCGGCKALHPKICQLAEMNPQVQFMEVNYEEHKSMCYSLNVHVLPFFRFYRGAHGRLCSFSCTNATIKKFRDALAKHSPDRCSLGPTKGLEEKELIALSENRDLSFTYTPRPEEQVVIAEPEPLSPSKEELLVAPRTPLRLMTQDSENKALLASGRF